MQGWSLGKEEDLSGNPSDGSTPLLLAAGRPASQQSTGKGQSSAGQTAPALGLPSEPRQPSST